MNRSWDVIVAGGGSAGLAAALVAARGGARTLLVERQTKLGGMGVNALVHTFCGLFHPDVSKPWAWLNAGVAQEVGEKMMDRTGQSAPDLMGRVYVLRQHPSVFAHLADELCAEEGNLTTMSGVEWCGLRELDQGWELDLCSRGLVEKHSAKALVDTTGDATGARFLGDEFWTQAEPERLYRPAYVCALPRVTGMHDDSWRLSLGAQIVKAAKSGQLPEAAMGAQFRDSPFSGEMFLTIDLEAGQGSWDPFDAAKRAAVEATGRDAAMALWRMLRAEHADFLHCPPPVLPAQAGIRETARYLGDHVLSGEALAASARFADEVALAGWPMEKRENARGPKFRFFDRAEPAGIPAGCLKNARLPGLFFAGRCLSADHEALASVRVMGTCMATGEAAAKMALAHRRNA
ncbi:MAG: FAD-dependent oxidoreductase [Verrucomicrobiota bacterium]